MKISSYFLFLFIIFLLFISSLQVGRAEYSESIDNPFFVIHFSGQEETYIIKVPLHYFNTPRHNYYLGVGGYHYNSVKVEIFDLNNNLLGHTTTWGGIIFLRNIKAGRYIIKASGNGKILLAVDLQNPNEIFSGKINGSIAFFIAPYDAKGININLKIGNNSGDFILEIYNQSLDKVYWQHYNTSVNFDFYFPSSSTWNDLMYIRIVPKNEMYIEFSWNVIMDAGKKSIFYNPMTIGFIMIMILMLLIYGIYKK